MNTLIVKETKIGPDKIDVDQFLIKVQYEKDLYSRR